MLGNFPFFAPFFLALRNMRTRRGRTFLTFLGIVLGVAVVLAIQVTNESTLASIRQVFDRAAGRASLLVLPRNISRQALDDEILAILESEEAILTSAPSLRASTILASEATSWEIAFGVNGVQAGTVLMLYGIDPQRDPNVRLYELVFGRMPQADAYEVVIPQKYAQEKKLAVGNDLVVLVPGGSDRLRIVGLLADQGVALNNGGAVAFAPLRAVQELFERQGEYDEVALRVQPDIEQDPLALKTLQERLDERLAPVGEVVYPGSRGELVGQMLATYQLGLAFFSVIAVFVGAFLIYNAFSMTVVERTRETGMLRAIGASRLYLLRMVLAEALILALLGSATGLVAGFFLARGLIRVMSGVVANSGQVFQVNGAGIAQGLGVGIGVTLASALIPAIQASRISPLEALRLRSRSVERPHPLTWAAGLTLVGLGVLMIYFVPWRQEVVFEVGVLGVLAVLIGATLTAVLVVAWLERTVRPLASALYGGEGMLGVSNIRRAVGRTTLTVASLMVALAMIISIGSLAYSLEHDLTSWIDHALGGDLYVRSPVIMREALARQLAGVPGVQVVSPGRYLVIRPASEMLPPGADRNETLYFNALDVSTYRQVAEVEFASAQGDPEANWRRLVRGKAVFISNVVSERYGLRQGDQIILLTRSGKQAFEVAAVVMDFAGQGLVVTGTYQDLHRWFSESGADRFTIKVAPGYEIEAVAREIESRFGSRQNISVQTTEAFKASILKVMHQALRLFDVLNLIGVIIGSLGVINTLTMNVLERRREIGALRSLGMTRHQTLRMVLAEALALGVMGGLYGLVFGHILAHILIRGANMVMSYDLVYLFTPRPYLIGVLVALVVAQLAAIPPARRAASINIIEAIQHE